ncbi:MAG: DUF2330 domain-containing protein [Myxococcales bacterium]|nr:DUF2330 domain-containing protein [Myxococcales bacterium]
MKDASKAGATLLLAAAALTPTSALACGGFFCGTQPVDQQAERIIFVQEDPDTVTSYVEIAYQGAPEDFAWVVPVPALPELDVWHGRAFNALDLATQPQYRGLDWCFLDADADGIPEADENGGDGEVQVLAEERVGPFDTATIESRDPRALVEWLRLNDYRIPPAMEPFIALYTDEGMKFLAMKLAPGEGTEGIQPIKMTYRAGGPAVPLRLTAVAALPEMGVKVWILGESRYGPLNMPEVLIPDAEVRFDPFSGQVNYPSLVARKVDDAGGHGFVTELAAPTAPLLQTIRNQRVPARFGQEGIDAQQALITLLESRPYITRLYTRLSPGEMDLDPLFGPVAGGEVSNIHDLPGDPAEIGCGFDADADALRAAACDRATCGAAGTCVAVGVDNWRYNAGCACPEGTVARALPDVQYGVATSCVDVRLNFTAPALDQGVLSLPDACASNPCGDHGECVTHNGFPSCRCERGFVAVAGYNAERMPVPICVAPAVPVPAAAYQRAVREPNLPYPGRVSPLQGPGVQIPVNPPDGGGLPGVAEGCTSAPGAPTSPLWALLILPLGLVARRRRIR